YSPQGRSVSLTISFGKGREAHLAKKSPPARTTEEETLGVPGLIVESRGERHTPSGGSVAGGVRLLRVAGQGGTRQIASDVELLAFVLVDRQGQHTEVLEAGTGRLGDDELAGGRVRDQGGHVVAGVEADVDDVGLLGGDRDRGGVGGDLSASRLGGTEGVDGRLLDVAGEADAIFGQPSEVALGERLGEGELCILAGGDGSDQVGRHLVDEDRTLLRLADQLALAVLEWRGIAGDL